MVMANIKRIAKHLLMTHWQVRWTFPRETLLAIEQAIAASESTHIGQLRFAVEGALSFAALVRGLTARERAIEVFSQLHVWDTEHNNGVLVYLLLADRCVEIVADRGIHARVPQEEWDAICREMEMAFRRSEYQRGVIAGIQAIGQHLERHFPARESVENELRDKPVIL
ncbi:MULTISPECIES: TPM domain-containing protein [Cupriavidus]|uniref:TPM domain-containing protein n=1 Tax=Cupriavidus pinatubonensis (strain JMP 134 / LMG 1197) TaxID=264198 RepID=Q46MW3_CUPPJ|nr:MULTISPECIES: TPM domain-containing protein [Cupriavidus]QYY33919.1 TPM domain-containing protein [Cupriavidus pinatubonensis]